MTTGILIHELVQKALTQKITSIEQLRLNTDSIIKESVERLYDAGLSEEEARSNIYKYVPPLADFMNTYVVDKPPTVAVNNICAIPLAFFYEIDYCCAGPSLGVFV